MFYIKIHPNQLPLRLTPIEVCIRCYRHYLFFPSALLWHAIEMREEARRD